MSNVVELFIVEYTEIGDSMSIKKIFEKVSNIVMNILIFIFGIILLILIYKNIQIKILGNDYASFFGYSLFEVQTGSMAGTIEVGDWIIVKYEKNIKVDDVITFKQDGEFITHRVIESYNGTYITKGDVNNTEDEPISKEQIVGKVVKILSGFGIIRSTLFNPFVLITLIITLYLINLAFKKNDKENKVRKIDVMIKKIIDLLKVFLKNILKIIKNKIKINTENFNQEESTVKVEMIDNKNDKINQEEITNIENIAIPVEDMDKTMYFRKITVDKDEIEGIYNQNIPIVEEEKEETIEKVEPESEIEKNLEIIQKKKKFKNVIEKIMYIKNEEIKEILDILNNDKKMKTNEPTIRETLLKSYIDAKYYNFCGDINVEYNGRNMNSRIEAALKNVADKMIKQYKGSDKEYSDKVKKYLNLFILVTHLELTYIVIDDLQVKKQTYKNKILKILNTDVLTPNTLKIIITQIIKVQRKYQSIVKFILEKLETNTFQLNFNNLNVKNVYGVELVHNLNFSKVYSDYIVDKTYQEGIVAEDKIAVLLNLLLIQIIKDMLEADFNKKYIIYMPESLYSKENKIANIFEIFEDEYAKNSVIVLTKYAELNKKIIKKYVKDGYHFAVNLENNEVKGKDQGCIELMDFIFVDKQVKKSVLSSIDVLASIPEELHKKVIYDDIASKVGDLWGE